MASHPTRRAILSLYSSLLRTSRSFSSYNFREYFVRRAKSTLRAIQVRSPLGDESTDFDYCYYYFLKAENDPEKVREMYTEAVKELAGLRRSVVVNRLYGGRKLAVEVP